MTTRVNLFGIPIDPLRMAQAVDKLVEWIEARAFDCRYVVTPNVDHAVLLQHHAGLKQAYGEAALILADGMPVVVASRLLRRPLPERVAGSDLVPALFSAAQQRGGARVFLLGAAPGVAERAAKAITQRWPAIEVVGMYSPPLGFERDPEQNDLILTSIEAARPDILLVGLGAPKQELWVHAHRKQIHSSVVLCIGATIDFLAGHKPRAPRWMRTSGLEWLHRLASEPRRLFVRYACDAWIFPQLIWREWIAAAKSAQ